MPTSIVIQVIAAKWGKPYHFRAARVIVIFSHVVLANCHYRRGGCTTPETHEHEEERAVKLTTALTADDAYKHPQIAEAFARARRRHHLQ